MSSLEHLLKQNRQWSERVRHEDPEFFGRLAKQQAPPYLWIGCSDSRVPANQIVGVPPGEVFVHRNVANVVSHADLNCLSVIDFAVQYLEVKHIIVCGHYGCGGVRAALSGEPMGLIDNWLRHIKDVHENSTMEVPDDPNESAAIDQLCELNVMAQVRNVCHTTTVQNAWRKGKELSVHGWIYSLNDGLISDMGLRIADPDQLAAIYRIKP